VGPVNLSAVADMISQGQLDGDTLMWTAGMDDWAAAENLADVQQLLNNQPPPMPA
jgi:hypothetical protein